VFGVALGVAVLLGVILLIMDLTNGGKPDTLPVVINTWPFTNATRQAFATMNAGGTALDGVEAGANWMELNPWESSYSVGWGGSPNEDNETTLDAMVMWAPTMEVGAVGCLKRVKKAISVARKVMEMTEHTLLVGDDATRFAIEAGFQTEDLHSNFSNTAWEEWVKNNHQPNYWKGNHTYPDGSQNPNATEQPRGHDTIGLITIDKNGDISCGASTNGLGFKIPGRVGDSPIMGAGAYCENGIGGAACTGNGDVMMRFLPSHRAVMSMAKGSNPMKAAEDAIRQIVQYYPTFQGAIITVNAKGDFGAAYANLPNGFPYSVYDGSMSDANVRWVKDAVEP